MSGKGRSGNGMDGMDPMGWDGIDGMAATSGNAAKGGYFSQASTCRASAAHGSAGPAMHFPRAPAFQPSILMHGGSVITLPNGLTVPKRKIIVALPLSTLCDRVARSQWDEHWMQSVRVPSMDGCMSISTAQAIDQCLPKLPEHRAYIL